MTKSDIKKKAQEFVDKYVASNIEKIYLWEGYVNGMIDLAYKLGVVISDETHTDIKEVNIKDRLTKPGIYYQVSGDDIVPIDFVKYFEVIHENEAVYEFEYEDVIYPYITYVHHFCCCSYTQEETIPYNCNWHFFETLDDAVTYVKEVYYAKEIQKHLDAITEIENKAKNIKNEAQKQQLI